MAKERNAMNENKKEKTTLFQREREIKVQKPSKNTKREEVRKVRPVTLASSYSPSPLTHHVTHTKYLHN